MLLACFYLYDYLFRVKHERLFISRHLIFPTKASLLREPCDAVMAVALLGDISNSYVQAIFKVKVRLQEDYSEKIALSHISKRYENAPKSRFTRLWTRSETGISDYDKLSKEQFVSLIEILKLSKYLKAPSTGEGKQNRKCRTASEKETQIRKPRHLLNAGVGVLFPCNALEFLA